MPDEKHVGMEISKTSNIIRRSFVKSDVKNQMYEATGKNGWIIVYLARNRDRDIFQRDIENEFSMRRSTVSNMIKLMEKKGYIVREAVKGDARLKRLVLTEKSLEMYSQMMEVITANEARMRRGISEQELEVFFRVMKKVQDNLEEEGGSEE